ncbi:MAG: polysaccharide deacetylase family protein [Oscillospiraceae bacterium]|nr:polysaccharide deacetylase family protein [Oscillospiraceae bacterium]
MKRYFKLLGFLLLMAVIFAIGAYDKAPDFNEGFIPIQPTPTFPSERESPNPGNVDPVTNSLGLPAVIEYGHAEVILHHNDPFHAYIRYPQAGNDTDTFIHDWASELYDDMAIYYNTGVEMSPSEFGEINVHFDSYLIDNRYAGILQFGEYSFIPTEIPQEIIKTFNIDLTEFEFLEPGDIIDLEYPDHVLGVLRQQLCMLDIRTEGYLDFMNEAWFSYLVITHDGILVILPKSEFLPDNFETMAVTLPYEDLGASLLIRKLAPLPEMPTPIPPPTPTPPPIPAATPGYGDGDGDGSGDGDGGGDGSADGGTGTDLIGGGDSGADGSGDNASSAGDGDGDTDAAGGDLDGQNPVVAEPQSGPIDPNKPIIALSLNDGPGIYTEEFVNLLEQYGVRATFCVAGNLTGTQTAALTRAVEAGSEVVGISWDHKNLAKLSDRDVRAQIEKTRDAIESVTGTAVPMFRPPYGNVSDTMKDVATEMGLVMIKWSVDPEDWKYKDSDHIYNEVMREVKDKAIIISQAIYKTTFDAYERIIPELLLQGYQIVTVSELLKLTEGDLTPGQIYYNG